MNTSTLFRRGLILTALFSLSGIAVFSAEPAATIFNRKSGLVEGWSDIVWGEIASAISTTVAREKGGVSLLVTPLAGSAAYAGLQIQADSSSSGIPLTEALRRVGEVHVYVRNGNDLAGNPAADHQVQLMLSFQPEAGKAFNGRYEQLTLDPAPAGNKASEGWQLVKVSIPEQLQGRVDAATPVKLRGVYVQYVDLPTAAYFIGECVVVLPSAK